MTSSSPAAGVGVVLVEAWGSGGIHTYTIALADALSHRGASVSVVTGRHAESLPDGQAIRQESVLEDFAVVPKLGPFKRLWSLVQHLLNLRRLTRALRSDPRAIVHVEWPLNRLASRLFEALGRRRTVVVTAHNVVPHESSGGAVEAYWRRVYASADAIVCHSEQTLARLRHVHGDAIADKARVIPHGVGVASWNEINRPTRAGACAHLELEQSARYVLFLGAIRPYKGLDRLVEAWPLIVESCPGAVLLVAGQGATWSEIAPRIDSLGVAASVEARIGWVEDDDIPMYLAAADVTVLPYVEIDGSGIVAAAAYNGTAMVLSDIRGFRSTVSEEEALYTHTDRESLAAAVCRVLQHPDLAAKYSVAAYDSLMASSSWTRVAELHLELYRELKQS